MGSSGGLFAITKHRSMKRRGLSSPRVLGFNPSWLGEGWVQASKGRLSHRHQLRDRRCRAGAGKRGSLPPLLLGPLQSSK